MARRAAADRLDLLGLDEDGSLVAELKRGPAPDTVEMQAIKYAAFASRFTVETLAEPTPSTSRKVGGERVSDEEAREPGSRSTRAANSTLRCSVGRGLRCWRRAFPHR